MQYLLAAPRHTGQVKALWAEVFGDGEAFIEAALDRFASPGHLYVAEEAGQVVAQALAVPCTLEGEAGVYLYALATLPEWRGKGVMAGLVSFVEQAAAGSGAGFCCLIPASEGLFRYYARLGYETCCAMRRVTQRIPARLLAAAQFDCLTARGFLAAREALLGVPYIGFDEARTAEVLKSLYAEGASIACTEAAYAVYFERDGRLLVPELGAKDTTDAVELLQAIREKTGCEEAVLTLPEWSGILPGEAAMVPQGMMKRMDDRAVGKVWLRFGFEELANIL